MLIKENFEGETLRLENSDFSHVSPAEWLDQRRPWACKDRLKQLIVVSPKKAVLEQLESFVMSLLDFAKLNDLRFEEISLLDGA